MRALVLGASGQLGRELQHVAPRDVRVVAAARADVDLLRMEDLDALLHRVAPDVVLNAAAYTAVDRAESEEDLAFAINAEVPAVIGAFASHSGARVVHVSTDYVFDGQAATPYRTDAPYGPVGAYGRSKALGEQRVLECGGEHAAVVRTSWLYSRHEPNFVLTILRAMRAHGTVRVVSDQVGSPTWARTLARAIWNGTMAGTLRGVAHWSDSGTTSWYGFAVEIARAARELGLIETDVTVQPIATADYPTPAKRPAYSVLDLSRAGESFGVEPTPWKDALHAMLEELVSG